MLLTDASKELKIPASTLRSWANNEYIAAKKIGNRWFVDLESVKEFVAICRHNTKHSKQVKDISTIRETIVNINNIIKNIKKTTTYKTPVDKSKMLKDVIAIHETISKQQVLREEAIPIPFIYDEIKKKYPISLTDFHKILMEWYNDKVIFIDTLEHPAVEERPDEGIWTEVGLQYYVVIPTRTKKEVLTPARKGITDTFWLETEGQRWGTYFAIITGTHPRYRLARSKLSLERVTEGKRVKVFGNAVLAKDDIIEEATGRTGERHFLKVVPYSKKEDKEDVYWYVGKNKILAIKDMNLSQYQLQTMLKKKEMGR